MEKVELNKKEEGLNNSGKQWWENEWKIAMFWILAVFFQNFLHRNSYMHILHSAHCALGLKMLQNIRVKKKASWGNVGCCL